MPPSKSLVVPVYKNERNIPELIIALCELSGRLKDDLEVVFVNDGSPDCSVTLIRELTLDAPFAVQVISHSRNFGSFAAMVTGLGAFKGQLVAVMAADLQEPIDLIEKFFEVLADDSVDVVVGARTGRSDGIASSALSNLFWFIFRALIRPDIPRGGVDVFGCSREVAQIVSRLPEANSSLVGLLYWIGFRRVEIGYQRLPRAKGKSAWGLRRRFRYLNDSVFSFTTLPISLILWMGGLGSAVALILSFSVFIAWLSGSIAEPGFTTLALIQLGSTGAILLSIGVVGIYVWRTFDNTKGRPNAIIKLQSG